MDKKAKKKSILGRILLLIITLGILGLASLLIINSYVKAIGKDNVITSEAASDVDADCILILGAGGWNNNRPSPMLEDRLLEGINLYSNGATNKLLMSGDHGSKDYDEVNVMKDFAIERGVPSEDIFMDHAGFSTYESLYRAREVFKAEKIIIVTQEYHLYRALYTAEKLGLEAYGVASDPRKYAGQSYRELREILARVKDFFYGIIKPEPTFLGEEIPVSGNGDDTND